jgi:phosphogluconate dehydratase
MTNATITKVTQRIIERSKPTRERYIARMRQAMQQGPTRQSLSCGNLAHGYAACVAHEKSDLRAMEKPNIAIVSAYNDMLSAHQPYADYPPIIKDAAAKAGAIAQFAGGTPAMCDGVTQGQPGMELSLFSRDVIAMSTAIALSHNMFDAAVCLGICDKIVPGLLMGALQFGHLPITFIPGGPMPSGIPNKEKAHIRELYAKGEVGRDALLEAESKSYHSAGTCTFYGTANTNQMMMELMGLQLPGSSFVNPGTKLRDALTREAVIQTIRNTAQAGQLRPLCDMMDERAIVNGIVGLHATGGSTNHTLHFVAIARAAGIIIDWTDFSELSDVVPLLCRIYPNGEADVNHFHAAGGMAFITRQLLDAGLAHGDVLTIVGEGLEHYTKEPFLEGDKATWRAGTATSHDEKVLAPATKAFRRDGGMKLLEGNLGRAVIKVSALKEEQMRIEAPAKVFISQHDLQKAFERGELQGDFVAVVLYQGPAANGMPELHKLTPPLGVLQNLGQKVALVTDGRMSGASGKVPAAIHVSPECVKGGPLAKVRDGDIILLDAHTGTLQAQVDAAEWAAREPLAYDISVNDHGTGRDLFVGVRRIVTPAEEGGSFALAGWE